MTEDIQEIVDAQGWNTETLLDLILDALTSEMYDAVVAKLEAVAAEENAECTS